MQQHHGSCAKGTSEDILEEEGWEKEASHSSFQGWRGSGRTDSIAQYGASIKGKKITKYKSTEVGTFGVQNNSEARRGFGLFSKWEVRREQIVILSFT